MPPHRGVASPTSGLEKALRAGNLSSYKEETFMIYFILLGDTAITQLLKHISSPNCALNILENPMGSSR